MKSNPVIDCLMSHKSIRKFSDQDPDNETIQTIVRAGQQAPFAGQSYSFLLSRKRDKNPWRAPLLFTICVDSYKFEKIMEKRGWVQATADLNFLMLAIQDASYAAENMNIAGRSLGLGSCFLGTALGKIDNIAEEYKLPPRVLPIVQLVMGYPAENPPTRPRYPYDFVLFEDTYPNFTDEKILAAMKEMDEGYLAQDYYKKNRTKIPLTTGKKEEYTFKNYSWTEHISRKVGQWNHDPSPLIKSLENRDFFLFKSRK
ncbi:nitroreductase family protein [Candidatus Bathyarchaeota archaeon]|nr:nitroreductase family protein [Candidatus Bathyarchaeota archaeon]